MGGFGEVLRASIELVNLPYTILLVLMLLYWGLYLLGALGSEALDFLGMDLHADADVDVHADADVHVDGHLDSHGDMSGAGEAAPGAISALVHFFYLGEIPVMLIFSVMILTMWVISLLVNHYMSNVQVAVAVALFVPIVLVSAIVTRAVLTPFAPALKRIFDHAGDKVTIVGKTCVVVSSEANEKFGQAEIETLGAPSLLNVRTRQGVTIAKGQEAVVVEHDEQKNLYWIAPLNLNAAPEKGE
jgi:hypothetical protein